MIWCAIGLAVLSAICLAGGTHEQSLAVVRRTQGALSAGVMLDLLRSPRWVAGLALLGIATVCNVIALSLAPVSVIQPVGVLALALTTVLHCRSVGMRINAQTWRALGLCTGGAALFVLVAIRFTDSALRITHGSATAVNLILLGLIAVVAVVLLLVRGRGRELALILSAGVLYGFVALEMKILTAQIRLSGGPWWASLEPLSIIGLLSAAALGGWLVQSAYASGPPELVLAGLTVVDPMIGVFVGLSVLGEAGSDFGALPALLLAACAAVSFSGIRVMSLHHPEVLARRRARESPTERDTTEV